MIVKNVLNNLCEYLINKYHIYICNFCFKENSIYLSTCYGCNKNSQSDYQCEMCQKNDYIICCGSCFRIYCRKCCGSGSDICDNCKS